MDLGVHLPLIEFGSEGHSLARLQTTVDAARDGGFAAVAANDHFVFPAPWLDGPTALAAVAERSGDLDLATTISLVALRGPVPVAKTLTTLDALCGGRVIAGLGPGSSKADYEMVGVPFEDRWRRFEEAVSALGDLLEDRGIPLWIGSWGSAAGLRRVARLADGWLASAYNTTPEQFATGRELLRPGFPNALATMWTWVTADRAERDRVVQDLLAPVVKRDPDELRDRVCIGSAEHCAELLSRYAAAGCERVYLWPLGDEARQLELIAAEVVPRMARRPAS